MNRLTGRNENGDAIINMDGVNSEFEARRRIREYSGKIIKKLCEYEEICDAPNELHARLDKAVILPCKADDTVWCIRAYNNGKGYQIEENSVMEIVFEYGNNMKIKTSLGLFGYDKWTYGLDCFTDRAKAEARLAELKGGG